MNARAWFFLLVPVVFGAGIGFYGWRYENLTRRNAVMLAFCAWAGLAGVLLLLAAFGE